jgi:hypothetical protein
LDFNGDLVPAPKRDRAPDGLVRDTPERYLILALWQLQRGRRGGSEEKKATPGRSLKGIGADDNKRQLLIG